MPLLIISVVLNTAETGRSWVIIWRPPVGSCDLLFYIIPIMTSWSLIYSVGKWRKEDGPSFLLYVLQAALMEMQSS